MQKLTIIGGAASLLLLAACGQPQPLCDREAQEWNKFDTAEDLCEVKPQVRAVVVPESHGERRRDQ